MNKETCEYGLRCKNNDKCYRCSNCNLLNLPKEKYSNTPKKPKIDKNNSDDSWKDLEQSVADKLNKIPTIEEARRSRRSGAMWFEKGDVVDSILHPECKERIGKTLKTGDKTISLRKDWLTKATEECEMNDKVMCLPFRFKNDNTIYTIMNFDDLAELITLIKCYIQDNTAKQNELEILKEYVDKLKKVIKEN